VAGEEMEKKKEMVGPTFGGGMEGLQKWRVGGGIWRGMQNGGLFRGPAGDGFLHQTSKFWSRGPYGGPCWRCSNRAILELSPVSMSVALLSTSFIGLLFVAPNFVFGI
jgi:hypothetical protein